MTERIGTNNERIARSIIMSNTNKTQRQSLFWLGDLEQSIVRALDVKDGVRPRFEGGSPQPSPLAASAKGSDPESGRGQPSPDLLDGERTEGSEK